MSHLTPRRRRTSAGLLAVLLAAVSLGLSASPAPSAAAAPAAAPSADTCARRANDTPRRLTDCVTFAGVRRHLSALQGAANRNGGTRAAGTPGYTASYQYVASELRKAGYDVSLDLFAYNDFAPAGPSALEQTAPTPTTYAEDTDFGLLDQTDPGDVTAAVTPVGIELGLGNASTSGCEPEDFAGFPAGNIALLQRGVCTFEDKIENAAAAGAIGAVIMNQGNTDAEDRNGIPAVTFGNGNTSGIPALATTYALGATLAETPGLVLRVFANSTRTPATSVNVLAETRHGDDANVVMVGAHLDSVLEGPGINDNGSGTAAILETAIQMRRVRPENTVRFAFWGAEESGLVGSTDYVATRTPEELAAIRMYLNFDMLGSPNFANFVYDGDGSDFGLAGPEGSAAIERVFTRYYQAQGKASEGTEIDFRSDYGAFFDAGIPFGGLFSGAEDVKTPEQAAAYGGTAGVAFDACYHSQCDTIGNISREALTVNSDSVANATIRYATAATLPGAAPVAASARVADGGTVAAPTTGDHATA